MARFLNEKGVIIGEEHICEYEPNRFIGVLSKIIRGLHYHHFDTILTNEPKILEEPYVHHYNHSENYKSNPIITDQTGLNAFFHEINLDPILNLSHEYIVDPEIFRYTLFTDPKGNMVWTLLFYNRMRFLCTVGEN